MTSGMPAAQHAPASARDPGSPPPPLQLQELRCIRGRRTLFSELSIDIQSGEVLRVQGANGAGKTSLLRIICGLLAPHHGQVLWRGQPITRLREEYGRELSFFGHLPGIKPELSALENLDVLMALSGVKPDNAAARRALASTGLAGHEHAPARTLSQGQRRRAALARLMLVPTALWVLDEPFNALDQIATQWLIDLIAQQSSRGGMVVLTSHQSVALPECVPQRILAL